MADILFYNVLNNEIEINLFLEWLLKFYSQEQTLEDIIKCRCSQAEFLTYFLNYIHEEIPSRYERGSEMGLKKHDLSDRMIDLEINKSTSFPLDLTSSTPKILKTNSDSLLAGYATNISPLYKSNCSFSTPTPQKNFFNVTQRSPMCLGDFIVNRKLSSKKKLKIDESPAVRKRINPTNLMEITPKSVLKSENSFDFAKSLDGTNEMGRQILGSGGGDSSINMLTNSLRKKVLFDKSEIRPRLNLVSYTLELDRIIKIYVSIIRSNLVLNLTSEIHFLISLLSKKQLDCTEIRDENHEDLFNSIHNLIYFASKSLQSQLRVLKNYERTTIRLLSENEQLHEFTPKFVEQLRCLAESKADLTQSELNEPHPQENVYFISDTDNRLNFPDSLTFGAFRKQRDVFYEILRLWEGRHLVPGWNFQMSLGGKIRSLIQLSMEPTNFVHLVRLFKAQLLSDCRNNCGDIGSLNQQTAASEFFSNISVDAQKLSLLKNRLVRRLGDGVNQLPDFPGYQEFFRDFIVTAANFQFNRHLCDALISEIVELNETNFVSVDFGEEEDGGVIKATVDEKKTFLSCIKALRVLAKFLGFVESLPYKTEFSWYSENLMATHLKIRGQVRPNFDIKSLLEESIRRQSIILCIPWLTKYLAMLDYVTLRLPYYTLVLKILFELYRNFQSPLDTNIYLIRFCLGWLFELPHFPDIDYFNYCIQTKFLNSPLLSSPTISLDRMQIIDQNLLYLCCPYLLEIRKLLRTNILTNNSITIKHITPVTALQSPDDTARRKLEQQLEEAFFNGQPVSTRKTVEFVSERVASTCVKAIVGNIVPQSKKSALENLKSILTAETDENVIIKQSNALACNCLKELRQRCEQETEEICDKKILPSIDSLVALDFLQQTKDVCVTIARKTCQERVRQWMNTHMTSTIFTKEFHNELRRGAKKSFKKDGHSFQLPPEGTNDDHNDDTISAAHLIENIKDMLIDILEGKKKIDTNAILELLNSVLTSFRQRGDINECILNSICLLLVDLCLVLLAHKLEIISDDRTLSTLTEIWHFTSDKNGDQFKLLLSPRNIRIFTQSQNIAQTWKYFAKFCAYLIRNQLLSCENFESQCTGIFRTEWDEESLKYITDFLKTFVELYREGGGSSDDFTFLLDFLSDYCEDL